ELHDKTVRNLKTQHVQADEIWCFVGAKQKNIPPDKVNDGWGDAWTWTAIDADSKLCVSYLVGGRDGQWAQRFMLDVAERVSGRIQITTDGHRFYVQAVANAFGHGLAADYAMLQKIYGPIRDDERRYSPPVCLGCEVKAIFGNPDPKHISTSYVERQNLTMRMHMRRFTRLTNAFSRKLTNLRCAVALHFAHYNFCRVHQTLRVTPAMEAGIADHVWTLGELTALLENEVVRRMA
ncbi:MAG: IS1 family transposase, partial [Terriglobales bacterium]